MGLTSDALAFVHTRYGVEFARRHFVFNAVKVSGNGIYACWVTHKYYFISQKLRFQVKVKARAVTIDDEL
jgi:hypothetical protein